jgi:hypothetical protein
MDISTTPRVRDAAPNLFRESPVPRTGPRDSQLSLPQLWCPFTPALHPDAQRFEAGTFAWMKRFGYAETLRQEEQARRAQFGIRAARVHPQGDTTAIQLVSDLTVWLFLTDDVYIEQPGAAGALSITTEYANQSLRILRNPTDLPANPSLSLLALADISQRLRRIASCEQVERVTNGMVEFFLAGCCEAVYFSRKALPSTAHYIPVRDAINCLRAVCFVFIEIAGGFELPGSTWCRPELQAVVQKAVRIVSNHHDLLSGLRELQHETPMNMPAVMAREFRLSMPEAFRRVAAQANDDTQAFVVMSEQLLWDATPEVAAYVRGLGDWIRGNLDWSLSTGRYDVGDHVAAPAA